jgi:hypothetical protein
MNAEVPQRVKELQQIGLLTDWSVEDARRAIDSLGEDASLTALLRSYYLADGDPVEALWRRQQEPFLEVPEGSSVSGVARALLHATPSLGPLTLRRTPQGLEVSDEQHTVTVAAVVRHARVSHRTQRVAASHPCHVVQAANRLQAYAERSTRFVELRRREPGHAFVGVSAAAAYRLFEWRATAYPTLEALHAYTSLEYDLSRYLCG